MNLFLKAGASTPDSGLTAAGFKFEKTLDMNLFLKAGASTLDNEKSIRTEQNALP
jgi:hypothetical protein